MTETLATGSGRRGRPGPVLRASAGIRLPRRAGRLAGARRGRRRDRPRAAGGERQPRGGLCHQPPRRGDPHGAEARAARFLGCEPHEVIFGPNMTSLDFTLSRTAGRDFAPGDEILVTSLDHDGGVAPWLELARDRDLVVRHVELTRTPRSTSTTSRPSSRPAHPGGRLRAGLERGRHDRRRAPDLRARARGRRALVDRRRPLRRARADRRPRARLRRPALLALQVLRPAPRPRLGRAEVSSAGGPTRRARRRAARSGGGSRRARCPTSCSPASAPPSTTWTRSAASPRSRPTSGGSASDPARAAGRGHRLRAARDGRPRADVPGQRRRRDAADQAQRLATATSACGRRQVVLVELYGGRLPPSRCGSASSTTRPPTRSTGSCRRYRTPAGRSWQASGWPRGRVADRGVEWLGGGVGRLAAGSGG